MTTHQCAWKTKTLTCGRRIDGRHAYCYPHFIILPLYYRQKLTRSYSLRDLQIARDEASHWVAASGSQWEKPR